MIKASESGSVLKEIMLTSMQTVKDRIVQAAHGCWGSG